MWSFLRTPETFAKLSGQLRPNADWLIFLSQSGFGAAHTLSMQLQQVPCTATNSVAFLGSPSMKTPICSTAIPSSVATGWIGCTRAFVCSESKLFCKLKSFLFRSLQRAWAGREKGNEACGAFVHMASIAAKEREPWPASSLGHIEGVDALALMAGAIAERSRQQGFVKRSPLSGLFDIPDLLFSAARGCLCPSAATNVSIYRLPRRVLSPVTCMWACG